eukprot:2736055-Prymnesium_polylepis.1
MCSPHWWLDLRRDLSPNPHDALHEGFPPLDSAAEGAPYAEPRRDLPSTDLPLGPRDIGAAPDEKDHAGAERARMRAGKPATPTCGAQRASAWHGQGHARHVGRRPCALGAQGREQRRRPSLPPPREPPAPDCPPALGASPQPHCAYPALPHRTGCTPATSLRIPGTAPPHW